MVFSNPDLNGGFSGGMTMCGKIDMETERNQLLYF